MIDPVSSELLYSDSLDLLTPFWFGLYGADAHPAASGRMMVRQRGIFLLPLYVSGSKEIVSWLIARNLGFLGLSRFAMWKGRALILKSLASICALCFFLYFRKDSKKNIFFKIVEHVSPSAMAKRIRFGFVFEGLRPDIGGQTPFADLDVAEAEGCEKDGRQFVVFTVCKPRRVSDVERVVEGLEGIRLVSLDGGPMIATFERGHSYQGHPIYRTIQSLCANCDVSYWRWSLDHPQQNRKKRVISELESDLADAVILPAAEKRASKKQRQEDAECILPLDDEGGVERQVEPACPFRLPSSCYYGLLCIGMRRCMRAAQLPSHVCFFSVWMRRLGKGRLHPRRRR